MGYTPCGAPRHRGHFGIVAQLAHAIVDAPEYRPAAQGAHVVAPGRATVSVTDPAAQSVQSLADAAPDDATYLPASQSMQSAAEVLPALGPYWPDAQSVHATVGAAENCPAAQGVHVDAPS